MSEIEKAEIHNVKIVKAIWSKKLGREENQLGLQLAVEAVDNSWGSCVEFDKTTSNRVLAGFNTADIRDIVGKWCVVRVGKRMGDVKYLGPVVPKEECDLYEVDFEKGDF